MDASCGRPHHVMEEASGFRGVEFRDWVATVAVEGWDPHAARPMRLALTPGTRLRLEQTDWCVQGCTTADVIVGQRFIVLDGPLAGRCIEFTAYVPDEFTAWLPQSLVEAALPSTTGGFGGHDG